MKYSFFHSLHLKVIIGYGFLVGLLVVIGFVMRYETDKLISVRTGELQREESRKLINRISGKLMDLTIPGGLLPLWKQTDFQQYHDNNQCVIANLNQLRTFYPDHSQCARIDSVCYLLEEKEVQIGKLYELFNLEDNGTKYWKPITVSHADSLKRRNEELNDRLDRIIHDFEREATKQSETEQEETIPYPAIFFSYTFICDGCGSPFCHTFLYFNPSGYSQESGLPPENRRGQPQ